ncbi:hypothetical protein D9758_016632 [Tetrapyrgos nigripes]|uniref:Cytochrome P450 n=1 Tax=Tetrapyrgos nigripes TaxID=182062 RepID=A0A8H5BY92_9AGAR|nr:hypothetical protein D9758_016632 [Tetrapyrgos nigripes]
MLNTVHLLAIPGLFIVYDLWKYLLRRHRQALSYPPGPKGLPIIGSFFDALTPRTGLETQWAIFRDMGHIYHSDVLHIDVLGDHTVVLNSAKAAEELLERRSGIYSSRPTMYMANESGWGWNFATMPYTLWWRLHRRTFHQHFRSEAIATYHPFIRQATSRLLRSLSCIQSTTMVTQYDDLQAVFRQHAASIILYTTYGITEQEDMEAFVELVNNAAESLATFSHGNFLVDYFPLLRYVPAWFPGAHFKRKATRWSQLTSELVNKPWNQLRASISSGTAISCFGTKCLQKLDLTFNAADATEDTSYLGMSKTDSDTKMEEIVRNCAGTAYVAGSDTSVSLTLISVLVLSHHPEIQAKAQEELDRVLGSTANSSQLPDFSDQGSLPYVEAVFKEILRMYPSAPLGVPHYSVADDVYEGYFIPKGTTVVGNAWAILHDESLYPDPLTFNPDRFLRTEPQRGAPPAKHSLNPDPELYAFGFGRRICPARHLALDTSWLVLVCLLATCNITRISSDNTEPKSNEIDPIVDLVDGPVVHPKPFKSCITPRSAGAFELMKSGYEVGVEVEA